METGFVRGVLVDVEVLDVGGPFGVVPPGAPGYEGVEGGEEGGGRVDFGEGEFYAREGAEPGGAGVGAAVAGEKAEVGDARPTFVYPG